MSDIYKGNPYSAWADVEKRLNEAHNELSSFRTRVAEELAALRTQLAEANERAKSLQASKEVAESLLKDADMLFNQELGLCDDANSNEWLWKWRVKYYFYETDIPVHAMPEDMKGEA